jgi:hypothetical protein
MNNDKNSCKQFAKSDLEYVMNGIPRLDLAKVKEPRALIDNFIIEGCTQLGYGKFGTRKTTLHLLAAWSVSRGIPFLGMRTRKRMVLYLDYENPAGVLKAYCNDLSIDLCDAHLTIWDRTSEPPPKPGDKRLIKFIRRCKKVTGHAPWIIFDSWTSLLRAGESGNEIKDATRIFRAVRRYCDLGATITLIDHTGKRGNEPIGTSAKMTQMDTAYRFSVQQDTLALDGRSSRSVIRVENFLKRFAPKDVGTFSIQIKAAMDGRDVWHTRSIQRTKDIAALKIEEKIELLKSLIRSNPNCGKEELAKLASKEQNVNGGKIIGRSQASSLLQQGIGEYWTALRSGPKKLVFKTLKTHPAPTDRLRPPAA